MKNEEDEALFTILFWKTESPGEFRHIILDSLEEI
jgi:hypothetical protein